MISKSVRIPFFLLFACVFLATGCGSGTTQQAQQQKSGSGTTQQAQQQNSGGICQGQSACEFLSKAQCENRDGCWVDYTSNIQPEPCKENPPNSYPELQACSYYESENSCKQQGGCFWVKSSGTQTGKTSTPAKEKTTSFELTPEEKLLQGTIILRADFDGDQIVEQVKVSSDGSVIGILRNENGKLVVTSYSEDWVNHEGGTGETGWNLKSSDKYIAGDFDGDGKPDIIIRSGNGQWLGILRNNSGRIIALGIEKDWLNQEGGTGETGWNLKPGDRFKVMHENNPDKIEVRSSNGKWKGIIYRKNDRLYAGVITKLQ